MADRHLHIIRPSEPADPNDEYRFDEEQHEYYFRRGGTNDWEKFIGVTRALNDAGISDYTWVSSLRSGKPAPPGFRNWKQYYLWRGGWVHDATVLIDDERDRALNEQLRQLEEERGLMDLRPRIDAYKSFLHEARPKIMLREARVYHLESTYAGTLDRTMLLNGLPALPDLKCSEQRATAIQTAAYEGALGWLGENVGYMYADVRHIRFGLELLATGKYKVHWYDGLEDFEDHGIWMIALGLAQWKRKYMGDR